MHAPLRRARLVALAGSLLAASASAAEASTTAPPAGLAVFTRAPLIVEATLSPGGRYLAAVTLTAGRRALRIVNLADHEIQGTLAPQGITGVGTVRWVTDDRLVVELVDEEGNLAPPRWRGEIYSVGVDCKGGSMIFGYRAGRMQTGSHIPQGEREAAWGLVVDRLRSSVPSVLVEARSFRDVGDRAVTLYRVNAITGVKDLIIRGPMAEASFLTDEDGLPRIAWAMDEHTRPHFFYRQASAGWEELKELAGVRAVSVPLGFSSRDRTLYLYEPDGSGFAVLAVSLPGGERKVLARNERTPPSHLTFDSANRLVAVEFEPDLPVLEIVEPGHPFARALLALRRAYPDEAVRILDHSADDARLLVRVSSDRDPGRYLVVDARTLQAEEVGEVRPWVNPEEMAEASPIHLTARDGLPIHGYLTRPPGRAEGPLPLVVIPHGGPFGIRFQWEFEPEAQLLAAGGFAVLQVNFRGSGGYGGAYQWAGYRHWGDRMVEDVIDATRHAVNEGWADPQRICIYGTSFGGYAALQAVTLEPELYRCAAGYAGVYDLERLPDREEAVTSRLARGFYRTMVGEDPEELRRASPIHHAERITARVFLAHGKEDRRAPFEQAERMRKSLEAQGRRPEWLVEPREGHGFYEEVARERFYRRLVEFLRQSTQP